MNLSVLLRIYW